MKEDELHEEYETITIEEALDIMTRSHGDDPSSYVVRDTKGEVVVDHDVIKVVHDAMEKVADHRFEYGGKFASLREKHNFIKMKKIKGPREYCPCCGEPWD